MGTISSNTQRRHLTRLGLDHRRLTDRGVGTVYDTVTELDRRAWKGIATAVHVSIDKSTLAWFTQNGLYVFHDGASKLVGFTEEKDVFYKGVDRPCEGRTLGLSLSDVFIVARHRHRQ